MRVAIFVVSLLAATTPSLASDSCMSKAEARQHFATSHLYWHGPDHCWNANPIRRLIRPVQQKADGQGRQPNWREALSELRPDVPNQPDVSDQSDTAQQAQRSETNSAPATAESWSDRWVDVVQVAPVPIVQEQPPPFSASARSPQLAITAGGVILIWMGIILAVELVRRSASV